jgi:hypothetical protein
MAKNRLQDWPEAMTNKADLVALNREGGVIGRAR